MDIPTIEHMFMYNIHVPFFRDILYILCYGLTKGSASYTQPNTKIYYSQTSLRL